MIKRQNDMAPVIIFAFNRLEYGGVLNYSVKKA